MSESIFGKSNSAKEDETHWITVSDLMAGLMMVFLFISVVLMRNALNERDKVKDIAATYQDTKVKIYDALLVEFKDDLIKWNAEIKKEDLSFDFKSPDVLFAVGKIELKPKFKGILSDFFPRYLEVIDEFKKTIEEVRIEGHTSSKWNKGSLEDDAYFLNMDLSQGRTRSVLSYLYGLDSTLPHRGWIKKNIAAVGYSSSKVILINGKEDSEKSRRVTFKLITNSETQILRIIDKK